MLKGIDPLLSPELLKIMAEMGHDDTLVLADANFTAMSLGAGKPIVRLPGVGMLRTVQAVTSLMPLAEDIPHPVACMQVGGTLAPYLSALQRDVKTHLQGVLPPGASMESVDRYPFYDRVTMAYAIVVTGELQPWANFILHKGVIGDTLAP
ncbi:MAG: RbsD or FucU transport [Polaromonas sp.]|nr:RbsD or FucU transport [Polaromonas sp.]